MNISKKTFFRSVASAAAGVGLLLILAACAKHEEQQMPPMAVQTAVAVKTNVPIVIDAFGNTREQEGVDIVPQVTGILLKTYIVDGAIVTNNQPLFLIDPSDYTIRVSQAEGVLIADRANLELSKITLERNRPLLAKNMVSAETFDTLKTKVDAATAQVQIDQAALDKARLDLARCTVTSTVNGVCSKRFLDNGNLVIANQTKLTNIRTYDPLFVDFSVPEQHLAALRREMAAGPLRIEVMPRGDTNTYTGELVFLDNAVDRQTGTIALRGLLPNPQMKLWSWQFINVRVFAGIENDAVMVPESAVQFGKDGPYCFLVTPDNKAELRMVKPGVCYDSHLQIVEGVAAGERVVVLGQFMLFPGARIFVAPPAGGRPGAALEAMPAGAAGAAEKPQE